MTSVEGWVPSKSDSSIEIARIEGLKNGGDIELRAYEDGGDVVIFSSGNPRLTPDERLSLIGLLKAADAFMPFTGEMPRFSSRKR